MQFPYSRCSLLVTFHDSAIKTDQSVLALLKINKKSLKTRDNLPVLTICMLIQFPV